MSFLNAQQWQAIAEVKTDEIERLHVELARLRRIIDELRAALVAADRVTEAEAQPIEDAAGCFRCGHDPLDDHSPGGCHVPGCGCTSPFGGLT